MWACLSKCASSSPPLSLPLSHMRFDFSSIFASPFLIYRNNRHPSSLSYRNRAAQIIIIIMHSSSSGLTAFPSFHSHYHSLRSFFSLLLWRTAFSHFHQFGFRKCVCVCVFVSLHLRLSVIEFKVWCCCCCFRSYVYYAKWWFKTPGSLSAILLLSFFLWVSTVVIVIILLFHMMILLGIFSLFSSSLCKKFFLFFSHLKSKVQKALLDCYILLYWYGCRCTMFVLLRNENDTPVWNRWRERVCVREKSVDIKW